MIQQPFDVLVVGAGPAGLNAALVLGRMRRRVLVLDTDAPAHAVSKGVHGFLAQDGTPPGELRRLGREQLGPYTTVELRVAAARSARRLPGAGFELELADGSLVAGRRLVLAHGMRYGLPDLDGAASLWGTRVFHCPYCHGWEVRDRPLAVYASGERAVHQALLLASLSDDVVLLAGAGPALSPEELGHLGAAGIGVRDGEVHRVEEDGDGVRVVFRDGPPLARHALFIQPQLSLASDLAASLGADMTDAGSVGVDPTGQTSIPGLYAAGDAGAAVQSVAVAAGSGARAAYTINAELALDPGQDPGGR
jgi:thioredoxin reductase